MNIRNINKFLVVALTTLSFALPASMSFAATTTKQLTCKQEAKKSGITDKKAMNKYLKECEKKRSETPKEMSKETTQGATGGAPENITDGATDSTAEGAK